MLVVDNGDAIRGIAEVASKLDFIVNGYVGTTATQLADGQLANSEGDLYASSANATVVTSITIVNTDSVARTFTLYLKPSAGTSRAITPVSLDLGIGHSFYTDGQRIRVMDASGQLLSTWAVDDSPVDGETDKPISSNYMYDHVYTPPFAHLTGLLTTKGKLIWVPTVGVDGTTGWTKVENNVTVDNEKTRWVELAVVDAAGAEDGRAYIRVFGLAKKPSNATRVNWDYELFWQFIVGTTGVELTSPPLCYVQLKPANTAGALAGDGIGIRIGIDGNDPHTGLNQLFGESYGVGGSSEIIDLSYVVLTADETVIGIHHKPGEFVKWYVDGVLMGTQANTNHVPTGDSGAACYIVVSADKAATDPDGATELRAGQFLFWQAFA